MSIILTTALSLIWLISLEPEPSHDRAADGERHGLRYHACDALSTAGLVAELVTVEMSVHFDLTSLNEFSRKCTTSRAMLVRHRYRDWSPWAVNPGGWTTWGFAMRRQYHSFDAARQLIIRTFYRALPSLLGSIIK